MASHVTTSGSVGHGIVLAAIAIGGPSLAYLATATSLEPLLLQRGDCYGCLGLYGWVTTVVTAFVVTLILNWVMAVLLARFERKIVAVKRRKVIGGVAQHLLNTWVQFGLSLALAVALFAYLIQFA